MSAIEIVALLGAFIGLLTLIVKFGESVVKFGSALLEFIRSWKKGF